MIWVNSQVVHSVASSPSKELGITLGLMGAEGTGLEVSEREGISGIGVADPDSESLGALEGDSDKEGAIVSLEELVSSNISVAEGAEVSLGKETADSLGEGADVSLREGADVSLGGGADDSL